MTTWKDMKKCTHCGGTYGFSNPCSNCESKGHTAVGCEKCEAMLMRGKIEFRTNLCVHCNQAFRMRGVPCNLCIPCYDAGHRGSIPLNCGGCKSKAA